jgi:hypothetical protein
MRNLFEMAFKSLRTRCVNALKSLCTFFAIDLQSLRNCSVIAIFAQSVRNLFAIALKLLRKYPEIAFRLFSNRFKIAKIAFATLTVAKLESARQGDGKAGPKDPKSATDVLISLPIAVIFYLHLLSFLIILAY